MFSLFCLGIIFLQQMAVDANYPVLGEKRAEGETWGYEGENGPDSWSKTYENCSGKMQSPIKINRILAERTRMDSITFYGYSTIKSGMTIKNNGHTAQLELAEDEKDKPYIVFGGQGAKYYFSQLHFHWGKKDSEGAEHIIYPFNFGRSLEVHFVHNNSEEAKNGNAGIAVLGLTFQKFPINNSAYAPITDALEEIRYKGEEAPISEMALASLLPDWFHRNHFFRYNGSLTTPPCTEGVIWNVFEDASFMGRSQIEMFRRLLKTAKGEEESSLAPNFRPVQPLNGRKIFKVHGDNLAQ